MLKISTLRSETVKVEPRPTKTLYKVVLNPEAQENLWRLAEFEHEVQGFLDKGWSLHGGTLTLRRGLVQAVTKVVDADYVEPSQLEPEPKPPTPTP